MKKNQWVMMALTEILVLKTVTSDTVLVGAMLYSLSITVLVCHKSVFELSISEQSPIDFTHIEHLFTKGVRAVYARSVPEGYQGP